MRSAVVRAETSSAVLIGVATGGANGWGGWGAEAWGVLVPLSPVGEVARVGLPSVEGCAPPRCVDLVVGGLAGGVLFGGIGCFLTNDLGLDVTLQEEPFWERLSPASLSLQLHRREGARQFLCPRPPLPRRHALNQSQ